MHTSNNINNHTIRTYGWRKQLPDRRDLVFAPPQDGAPEQSRVDLRDTGLLPDVYDQGKLGSCTANAIAAAFEYDENRQEYAKAAEFTPSRLFIYYNERAMEGTTPSDSGAEIRDGIKSINKLGVCDEKLWPYDIEQFTMKPPQECYDAAKRERALKYQRVEQNLTALKHALATEKLPVVFGFTVYESFEGEAVASTGRMPMPKAHEKVLGGHAVMCVGYDDEEKAFLVRNSWSDAWGMDGYFYMPYEFMTDSDCASDFWVVQTISAAPVCAGEDAYLTQFPALSTADTDTASATPDVATGEISDAAPAGSPALMMSGKWAESGAGEYTAGRAVKVTWDTKGEVVPRVTIQYCVNSWSGMLSSWSTIVESTPNHGSYRWHIPEDAAIDTRYYVRVMSATEPSVRVDSEYFAVVANSC